MIEAKFLQHLSNEIAMLKETGYYKPERVINSQQSSDISITTGQKVVNFCANNYLGLANHPELIKAGQEALAEHGYGMASVRFICGTQTVHKALEQEIATFLNKEDSILYSSCFDANAGLFETILGPEDAIISDELNHASIIDGVRLCKAARYRYKNNDMQDLEKQLQAADEKGVKVKLIATDGVFSMDGIIANLPGICDLAEKYNAMVMVDDSHAVGFMGEIGAGTPEHCGVVDRIDIITGTLGKALGGASGGYTAGKKEIIEWLRQRSRPYLFSNALAPVISSASVDVLKLIQSEEGKQRLVTLRENSQRFRAGMADAGFDLIPGEHPIIPVMLYDAKLASDIAQELLAEGIYVIAFSFPVVPKGKARIRTQMSAAHTPEQIDHAVAAFVRAGRKFGAIN
ncbi:glycine C-acetyltransferase [Piscirickettsiaceae bacterium NZ-RLO2]|nr:glycine C-acetyltransferase [Piscirickettsiaceae bacterium NZ-RLO2]